MIRIVIIDDSAFMRKALQIMLESDPDMQVVGIARDGEEGIELVKREEPDCIVMDIEMPRMDGLKALDIIMQEMPTPVLVVSPLTRAGAAVTLEALDKGALDFIPKLHSFVAIDITGIKQDLLTKVRTIANHRHLRTPALSDYQLEGSEASQSLGSMEQVDLPTELSSKIHSLVAIGASTGGPPVIQSILENLPADFPVGIIIAQHMPPPFTGPFAERLNRTSPLEVKEAVTGDEVTGGVVLIGPGGRHMMVERQGDRVIVNVTSEPGGLLYHPSVDVLLSSAVKIYGPETLGVILTGMGQDGLIGLKELDSSGGTIVVQDEESSAVYGMSKAAVEAGITGLVTSAAQLPAVLRRLVS